MAWPPLAQQSASFEISDHVFNSGGHPTAGTVLSSTSFRITLDALGDSIVGPALSSVSFGMEVSFGSCYPPPEEVSRLRMERPPVAFPGTSDGRERSCFLGLAGVFRLSS